MLWYGTVRKTIQIEYLDDHNIECLHRGSAVFHANNILAKSLNHIGWFVLDIAQLVQILVEEGYQLRLSYHMH